jgi:hypothetical protein
MGEQDGPSQATRRGFLAEPVVWYVMAVTTALPAAAYWYAAAKAPGGFEFRVLYCNILECTQSFDPSFLAVAWTVITAGLYLRGYFLAKPR